MATQIKRLRKGKRLGPLATYAIIVLLSHTARGRVRYRAIAIVSVGRSKASKAVVDKVNRVT